ncbi:hypothetical protein ACVNIS_13690 [Sphaerotilaceae bacterium SBD11-9]
MNPIRHTLAALASACLFTACGGGSGSEESAPPAPTPVAASVTEVQIEGCVVDLHDQAHATRVHAFGEDGRLLANATSTPQGVFVMTVPARQNVHIGLDAPGQDGLDVMTGSSRLSLGACLRDSTA